VKRSIRAVSIVTVLILSLCAFTFPGCSTVDVKNPQQAVLVAYGNYTQAAEGAAYYGTLPLCDEIPAGTYAVCANRALVLQVEVVLNGTRPIIEGAKKTVLDPKFDDSKADAVVVSAQNALAALTAITATLPKKPKP
jgi:hypothetical protein